MIFSNIHCNIKKTLPSIPAIQQLYICVFEVLDVLKARLILVPYSPENVPPLISKFMQKYFYNIHKPLALCCNNNIAPSAKVNTW